MPSPLYKARKPRAKVQDVAPAVTAAPLTLAVLSAVSAQAQDGSAYYGVTITLDRNLTVRPLLIADFTVIPVGGGAIAVAGIVTSGMPLNAFGLDLGANTDEPMTVIYHPTTTTIISGGGATLLTGTNISVNNVDWPA